MKPVGGFPNSCSRTFCISTSESLQVEGSNKETINLRKRNLIKNKQNKNKTIDNVIEKHILSKSTDSFQDAGFALGPRQCDAIERNSAVLDLVSFVDKVALLGPNRLGEICSCSTSAIFRQYELRKKRYRPSSYNNACAKQRCGSNCTMSKKRSCLLRTILNTKYSQSTPSQCTYNFTSERKQSHGKAKRISVQCEKQPIEYSIKNKERCKVRTHNAPTLEQVLLPIKGSDTPQKDQRLNVINNFCFSLLGSKSKDSLTCVVSSDLSSKLFPERIKEISDGKKILNNGNPDRSRNNNTINRVSNLCIKSTSSLITMCSVNKACKAYNCTTCNAFEAQVENMKRKNPSESRNEKELPYYASKNGPAKKCLQRKTSWLTTPKTALQVLPLLAHDLPSSYKQENQVHKCEIKWDFSLTSRKCDCEKNSSENLSLSSCTSKEIWIPTTNIEKELKRSELFKDYQPEKNKADVNLLFSNSNRLRRTDLNTNNVNEKSFVKEKLNVTTKSELSVIVSMAEIKRLLKNNQAKVIDQEGRKMRFKNVDSNSHCNIKRKKRLSHEHDTKTSTLKREEMSKKIDILTSTVENLDRIVKEANSNSRGFQDLKLNPKSLSANREYKRSHLFGSIVKYFHLFSKQKRPILKELVNTSTDVPSLNEYDALKMETTGNHGANKAYPLGTKTDIDKYARINITKKINTLRNSKSNFKLYSTSSDEFCITNQVIPNNTTTIEDGEFVNEFDVETKNFSQKHNGIKHKLKTYLSAFQILNQYKNKCKKCTPSLNVNNMKFEVQNSVIMQTTKAQYDCSLSKKYVPESPENYYYTHGEELNRNNQSPHLYNFSYKRQPTSRYNIKMMKQREHRYRRFAFEQEQFSSSLSDTPSYSYKKSNKSLIISKYDFAEDELIYKAIRKAIKRQTLKRQHSELKINKPKSRRKCYRHCQRQQSSGNSFTQRFYAMNVHRLKPYECEPGVCVPNVDECDPNECIKLINKRLKKKAATATSSGSKSISSQGARRSTRDHQQGYSRSPRGQSTRTYAPAKQNAPAGVAYTRPAYKPPKKKQAVRVGSSFSFNVEFSKGKSGRAAKPQMQIVDRPKEQEKPKKERHSKAHKAAGRTKEYKHRDSSTSTVDPNKHGKLKRCLCTLKLQKKGNQEKQDDQAKHSTATVAQATKRHDRHHLDPHECEPNVCIPGSCDPNECLKRIKYQDRGFNAEPISKQTSSSGTSPERPREESRHKRKRVIVPRERVIAPREHHKSEISPNKQAVKIGSTFSFSLEFYKNLAPPVVSIEPDHEVVLETIAPPHPAPRPTQEIKGRKVGRGRSSATSMISDYGVDRGLGPPRRRKKRGVYGLHDRGVESRLGPRSESRGTGTLRRCFCTLKLHKHGKVPAGQVKLVKHHGTESDKYKDEPDYYSKGANTRKLLPYECEPGFCIPGECDPYECEKRIQARYCRETGTTTGKRGRYPKSHSTATVYKHAQQGTKQPRYNRPSRGSGYQPDYRNVAQSIKTVVEEPRYRPILRKTRQVVRLGSDFKFNIEFFKDKTEHKTECLPPKPKSRGPSWFDDRRHSTPSTYTRPTRQSYFKRSRPPKASAPKVLMVKCACPVEKKPVCVCDDGVAPAEKPGKRTGKSQSKSKRQTTGTSPTKHHGSTMTALKRCFCTLSLKNKEQTQTVYTVFPNKCVDPFHYIENRSISNAINNWDGENSCSSAEKYQRCNEIETLVKEVLGQPQLPSLYKKKTVQQITENVLPYINSQVFFEDYSSSKDKWSSVTGFLPYCKKSICTMRVHADTCGPKTCNGKPCNFASCPKKGKNKQEDTKTLNDNNTKSTTVEQLHMTKKKKAKVIGKQVEGAAKSMNSQVVDNSKPAGKRYDSENLKDKSHANRYLSTQRTVPPAKYPREYNGKRKVVEESRFKSINDPFRQAVHITSSFTLNLEFRRDKLPDDLKVPYADFPDKPRTGISVQTRRQKLQPTEKSVGVGAGQIGQCPCSAKLKKFGMDAIEMKNKNINCDLPFQPLTADAGVGTKHKYKVAPFGCDPMCDQDYCSCSTRKGSKARRPKGLHKRESVQIGSKFSCNVEFFKDHTYSLGPSRKGADQYSRNARQSKQPGINIREAPRSQRNEDTKSIKSTKAKGQHMDTTRHTPQNQMGSPSVKTNESGVGPALKRCFCTLKFQKQIVNYLSVDTKSPLKLKHAKFTESNRYLKKYSLASENETYQSLQLYQIKDNTINKTYSKNHIKDSEMETIYPYIPDKFNNSRALLRKEHNERKLRERDYKKRQERDYRRQNKSFKTRETYNKSQKDFLGLKNVFHAHHFFLSLKNKIFKKPFKKSRKPVNVFEQRSNKYTNRNEKRKPIKKILSIDIMRGSKTACCPRKQFKYTKDTLKFSRSDRRPIKSKATKYPKKSESSRPTILEIRKLRRNKGWLEQKKYSHYQSGDADEYLRKVRNRNNISSHCEIISENIKSNNNTKLNPYMDNKLVYVSLVNQSAFIKNKPEIQKLDNEPPQEHEQHQRRHEQHQTHERRHLCETESKAKPLFDMHLKASDMSLLNTDDIYDRVMQLKSNQNQDQRKNLKIMRQLHGEMCCCCVCKALRKQQNLKSVKKVDTKKSSIRKHILALKNKQKSCVCKSKICEKEFKKKQLKKQTRAADRGKGNICVCGTKICKKETLKQTLKKKNMSLRDRTKYLSLLHTAEDKLKTEIRKRYLKELAREVKLDLKKEVQANKLAKKNLKKFRKSNSIVLCTDALIDVIKYMGSTVFRAVRCLFRAIINPKRTYYKLRYPNETLTLDELRPTSLTAMAGRMGTRLTYSPECKAAYNRVQSNRCVGSMLTAIDGKKRKVKKEDPRQGLITTTNFGCSLFMSSLRKKPFLKVYFTCPWFYPHCINLLKLGRNCSELLLFGLAVLVWSPCILCMECARGLMCCTMCTS